jgi:hypothetical protein
MAKKVVNLRIVFALDEDPDLSHLSDPSRYNDVSPKEREKYLKQDKDRLESYGDSWNMIGTYMEADVDIDGVIQRIRTPGLWGTESDSDKKYLMSIAKEEYGQLVGILKEIGVRRVPPFSSAEVKDRS